LDQNEDKPLRLSTRQKRLRSRRATLGFRIEKENSNEENALDLSRSGSAFSVRGFVPDYRRC
jgi:hypothetical protein